MCPSWANFCSRLFEYILAAQRCNFSKRRIPAGPTGWIVQFQVSASLNLSKAGSFFPPAFTAGPMWKMEGLTAYARPWDAEGEVLGWRWRRAGRPVRSSEGCPGQCQVPTWRTRIVFNFPVFICSYVCCKKYFECQLWADTTRSWRITAKSPLLWAGVMGGGPWLNQEGWRHLIRANGIKQWYKGRKRSSLHP